MTNIITKLDTTGSVDQSDRLLLIPHEPNENMGLLQPSKLIESVIHATDWRTIDSVGFARSGDYKIYTHNFNDIDLTLPPTFHCIQLRTKVAKSYIATGTIYSFTEAVLILRSNSESQIRIVFGDNNVKAIVAIDSTIRLDSFIFYPAQLEIRIVLFNQGVAL